MKRLSLLFLLLLSFNSFAAWETIETVDEFREPTGQIRIAQDDSKRTSFIFIDKESFGYEIGFGCREYIGGEKSELKAKVDKNEPIIFEGKVWKDKYHVAGPLPKELLEQMKAGITLKVLIEQYDGQKILLIFDLRGFQSSLKKLKPRNGVKDFEETIEKIDNIEQQEEKNENYSEPEYFGGEPEKHNNHTHYTTMGNSADEIKKLYENKVHYFNKYYNNIGYSEFEQNGVDIRVSVFTGKENSNLYYYVIQYGSFLIYANRVQKGECDLIPKFK